MSTSHFRCKRIETGMEISMRACFSLIPFALLATPLQAQQAATSSAETPPRTVFEALRPFYDQLDLDHPAAGTGVSLDPAQALTRIAFGSCHDPERAGMEILDRVAADNPDVFIYTGDNVYGDAWSWDATLPELRSAYAALAASPEFRALRAQIPMLAVWDDHDYGLNDFGRGFPFKEYAERLFLDFWAVPEDDERRSRDGIYTSRVYGPEGQRTQIILLDTRYFRSDLTPTPERGAEGRERYIPSEAEDQDMLGDAQWAWLEDQLSVPADLRLIVSSIQVHADGHGWEAWRTLPQERARLYNLLETSGAEGVILMSGDRHSSGIYVREDVIGYPLYEITSSSLNMSFQDENNESGPHRIGEMYAPVNYGVIDVNWEGGSVSLEIRDADGLAVRDVAISLDDLAVR
ncbi:alkaline phosphatase family protein [Hyphobacterium sp. CCMP332]|uniref:alkaline phosphatase D family protein n=1 Tax=Hyphobacterium sp. CCMP332 TaxID=2749086 RepID=UPI00164F0E56|nr:alkaline phosphatase D family protein [Hyphobacterium sp. CCMP332]QNL20121.1 alkaline phosphatase family protein [Hyphobacterium sp. CCMP332]